MLKSRIEDLLTRSIVTLFNEERFYAETVLGMDRKISNSIDTAGVYIKKGKVQLVVNAEFFSKHSLKGQVAILKHECQHIIDNHIGRGMELAPEVYDRTKTKDEVQEILSQLKHKCMNIAADAAINPGIKDIPDWSILPKLFGLPDGETFEWYLANLKNNEKAKNFMQLDNHAIWAESDCDKESLNQHIKKLINNAARKTRAAGLMTGENELLVSRLNKCTVNWKSELKRFVAKQIECSIESSKKKRNRRYGVTLPGSVKIEDLHIGVAIDTSGSVSDEAINQFMAEIGNISRYAKVTVVEADSEIKNIYDYDPKKTYSVKGRGGTAYKPALDYFTNKTKVDGVIYFGDIDTSDEKYLIKPKGYSVLWAIVGDQKPPVTWGSVTRVVVGDRNA